MMNKTDRSRLALGGLALAALMFLAVNMFSNATFRALQLDMTEGRLFTLSDGTRKVLSKIDEPIRMRLFFSSNLGKQSPAHTTYFKRVKELLGQYANISNGKLILDLYNPEPYSDAEDMAVAFGLEGTPVNAEGDMGYFGLAATNSTDDQQVIKFLTPSRKTFLEYDLTKLVHTLINPKKKVVGLWSSLPIMGATGPQRNGPPKWSIVSQIEDFFEVSQIARDALTLPEDLDILMLVHPKGMKDEMLYAIDQFVLKGGRVMAFVDTNAETAARPGAGNKNDPVSEFDKTLTSWGVQLVKDKVAGDLGTARRVNVQQGAKLAVTDYVAWLSLKPENVDEEDVVTGDIQVINIGTSGILEPVEGKGTTLKPLFQTSQQTMQLDRDKVMLRPDVVGMFRDFKPENKRLTLAARITGTIKSAFPDGNPDKKKTGDHLGEATTPINVIVVADTDMLQDNNWVETQQMMGNALQVPFANNANFVVNALENLSGSEDMIGLRARTETPRSFQLVHEIRQAAEIRYRTKEQELQTKLVDVRAKLNKLMRREEATGKVVLNSKEKELIETFRGEMSDIRIGLRDVQHALRSDIERLDSWLKFFNIAAIPLLLGFAIIVGMIYRRSRQRSYVSET